MLRLRAGLGKHPLICAAVARRSHDHVPSAASRGVPTRRRATTHPTRPKHNNEGLRASTREMSQMSGVSSPDPRVVETPFGRARHWIGHRDQVTGLRMTEHFCEVPLRYALDGDGKATSSPTDTTTVVVFAREISSTKLSPKTVETLPYLVYLQGGPGFESPRPLETAGWFDKACESFRVLLLDQRGTGRSTPISSRSLAALGDPEAQAAYLAHFRADSIVRDAEVMRHCLQIDRWSIVGQSFGGFCACSYLSLHPEGLREAFIMGGLPPTTRGSTADDVYARLIKRVQLQNEKYYARFPQDKAKVADVMRYLLAKPEGVETPAGNTLTAPLLQTVGIRFGSAQGLELVHWLFEDPWEEAGGGEGEEGEGGEKGGEGGRTLSYNFLKAFDGFLSFDTNVLYAVLHESIYVCGPGEASGWSAHRTREAHQSRACASFDAARALDEGKPVYFTGEMIFPFMFDAIKSLRPLKACADIIAAKKDWGVLYDDDAMRANAWGVPVAAAVYVEDMYVDFDLSRETAEKLGARMFMTNEYVHSGIRENGPRILEKLYNMTRGVECLR